MTTPKGGGFLLFNKNDYIWLIGGSNATNTPIFAEGTQIDFNTTPPTVTFFDSTIECDAFNAHICTDEGQLLFYSNGCTINLNDHTPMTNGDGLAPGYAADTFCPDYPVGQGGTILPFPEHPNEYLLIQDHLDDDSLAFTDEMLYARVYSEGTEADYVIEKISLFLRVIWQVVMLQLIAMPMAETGG